MPHYAMYLRKSRKDIEAEMAGEGETLARHRAILLDLAKRLGIGIERIYEEVASGESIQDRPVMQQLLDDVAAETWSGVLVVEVERLARGDTRDQGMVQQAFTYSGTKIITPSRTYDPANNADAEYFEFGLFFSRVEYRTIRRRMLAGREQAVREGKYPCPNAPYGYRVSRLTRGKGCVLEVVPEDAKIVRMIFDWYVHGVSLEDGRHKDIGTYAIAMRINGMGLRTKKGNSWGSHNVREILRNPTYTGKIRWYQSGVKKRFEKGEVTKAVVPTPERTLIVDGLHEAIISESLYEAAQARMEVNTIPRSHADKALGNPFAGLAVCAKCGRMLIRQNGAKHSFLRCLNTGCDCAGCKSDVFERRLMEAIEEWAGDTKINLLGPKHDVDTSAEKSAIERCEKELVQYEKQRNMLYTLLERGVYSDEVFIERQKSVAENISAIEATKAQLMAEIEKKESVASMQADFLPRVQSLLDGYSAMQSAQEKNAALKAVLSKIEYSRDQGGYGVPADNFYLRIVPKLPQN